MLFDAFGRFSCSLLAAVFLQTYNAFGFGCLRSFRALLDALHRGGDRVHSF